VSANVDAGFSIVSYTGTGSTATVGHGLSRTPELMLIKDRDQRLRGVFISVLGKYQVLYLSVNGLRQQR
jgi:hypothetical protein